MAVANIQKTEPRRLQASLLPTFGVALLPKLSCPACWPAYSGLLSSMGLNFVNYTPYLLPLTLIFIGLAVGALAYKARQRRGYAPLYLGLIAGATLIVGKFNFNSDTTMYIGMAMLVAASLWNAWPRRNLQDPACPACASPGQP